jgi:hypothetical protein
MAQLGQMIELLQGLASSDQSIRTKAENMYQEAKKSRPDESTIGLLMVLSQDQDPARLEQACVLLRQHFRNIQSSDKPAFHRCNAQTQQQVASELLKVFEAQQIRKVQTKVGNILDSLVDFLYEQEPPQKWPELFAAMFRMASGTEQSQVAAFTVLKDSLGSKAFNDEVVNTYRNEMGALVQAGLTKSPSTEVQLSAVLLVLEMVNCLKKKEWQPLQNTLPVLLAIVQRLLQEQKWEELNRAFQAMIDTGTSEPAFWKPKLNDLIVLCSTVCKQPQCRPEIRNLALEFIVNYAENSPKAAMKNAEGFAGTVIDVCMAMLLEVDAGDQELKEWMERMDDEEGEEDEEEIYHNAEECIDRVASSLKIEAIAETLFRYINEFAKQPDWKARHAAATACKQTVEYVEEKEHVTALFQILLPLTDDQHPRVRYMALFALGQLSNDHPGDFQEIAHKDMMPQLQKKMDDPVDRVAAMAMSSFVSFGEELDDTVMRVHSKGLMDKLATRLNTSRHRGVREEAITSIAVIAGVLQKDFTEYYDQVMPMLKHFVLNATGEKENRLRGKAFECMSLLGIAVGKDKFKADAQEALSEMFKVKCADDDVQKEYIKEACERIATCLKKDFAPFLPQLLPIIFENISLEKDTEATTNADDDDPESITVERGDGKLVKVKTSKFESMQQSVQLLKTFAVELETAYFPYVQDTAKALLPLLSTQDEVSMLCDEARSSAYSVWAELIKVATTGAKERGTGSDMTKQLLQEFVKQVAKGMEEDEDPSSKGDSAQGIADCIKNAGEGILGETESREIITKMFIYIEESQKRSGEEKKAKNEDKDEDDEEEEEEDEEDLARRRYEEAIGAVMKANPDACVPALQSCVDKMNLWFKSPENKVLALYLACDLLEHMGQRCVPLWPQFMETVIANLHDKDPDARQAAAYAVNLGCKIPQFKQAAGPVFGMIGQWLLQKAPKKRDEKARAAVDNAVAAMMQLCAFHWDVKPPELDAWALVLDKMPLKSDQEEGKKCHKLMVQMLLAENAPLLGPDNRNLGKIMSCMAEIHNNEGLSDKELDGQIEQVFKKLPDGVFNQHASCFSEKQQMRIVKIRKT